MPRCPKCWSGIDRLAGDCPHCGAPLGARRRRGRWIAYLLAAVAGAGGFLLMRALERGDVSPDATDATPEVAQPTAPRQRPPAEQPTAEPERRLAGMHWRLQGPDGRGVDLLTLRSARGPALVGFWSLLPAEGLPQAGGQPIDFAVLQLDPMRDLILLVAPEQLPRGLQPRALSTIDRLAPGQEFDALTPAGNVRATTLGPARADGSFELSAKLPPATALLAADQLVAIVRLDGRAMPLGSLQVWLDADPSRDLAALITERRATDPALVLEDVDRLLRGKPSPTELRQALDSLAMASMRADDRELLDALTRCECDAWRLLARSVFELDALEAVGVIGNAVARHPSDPGLLQDAALLLAQLGDVQQAMGYFARLQAIDQDRATAIEAALAEALNTRAAKLLKADRATEAVAQLEAATRALPLRADLQAALARALERAGRGNDALAAAQRAADLDPIHREFADQLTEARARAADPSVVAIPFDPKTFAIRTEVKAGGIPVQLVVDTGATTTTIPIAIADRLGLRSPQNPRAKIQTASGMVEAEVVRLPTLRIGTLELRDVEAIAHDLPGTLAGSGLLGMNALQHFRVEIDSERSQMLLQRR